MNWVDGVLPIVRLVFDVGSEIIEAVRQRKINGDTKLKDIPGWKRWNIEKFDPKYDAALEELRKRRKKP